MKPLKSHAPMNLIPAAILIALRQVSDAPLVLLVHRNPELPVQGGAWAFPGGRVAVQDGSLEGEQGPATARACAVRETHEETGLVFDPAKLILLTHWVTPVELATRFFTWMFIAADGGGKVNVDGREIIDHRWCAARQALGLHHAGEIRLTPPAFVILSNLARHTALTSIMDNSGRLTPDRFEPRLVHLPDGGCAIYREDAGYAARDIYHDGVRHRLWMRVAGWLYERSFDP